MKAFNFKCTFHHKQKKNINLKFQL